MRTESILIHLYVQSLALSNYFLSWSCCSPIRFNNEEVKQKEGPQRDNVRKTKREEDIQIKCNDNKYRELYLKTQSLTQDS